MFMDNWLQGMSPMVPSSSLFLRISECEDGLTDHNPYLGPMGEAERAMYKQALISGADDALMKGNRTARVIHWEP
jgi:hypothetical protein